MEQTAGIITGEAISLLVIELKDKLESLAEGSGRHDGQASPEGLDLELALETILGMQIAEDHLLIESMLALLATQVELALGQEGIQRRDDLVVPD